MSNALMAHCGALKMTRAQIKALPTPKAMGERHVPIPHIDVIESLTEELLKIGLHVHREELAVDQNATRDGKQKDRLFGIFDLKVEKRSDMAAFLPAQVATERGLSVGFRTSNDQTLALSGVAGTRIFVCDNLMMYGEMIAFHRKHTSGVRLHELMRVGVDRLANQFGDLNAQIERLMNTGLNDYEAKAFLIDAFCTEDAALPIKYLPDVARYYMDAGNDGGTIEMIPSQVAGNGEITYERKRVELPDVAPRNLWGLNNAFTRVVQKITSIPRRHEAGVDVGRLFGISTQAPKHVSVNNATAEV
jgi:hypothetical protein